MKKHTLFSKILTFVVCAVMLMAALSGSAFAAGETEKDAIVINSLPYSVTQEFYKIDTGTTEDVTHTDEDGNQVVETVKVYENHFSYYYKYTATRAGRLTVQLKATGVFCAAAISINGSSDASIYTDGNKSTYVDLREGDVVMIHLETSEETKVTMNLSIADYPKGSQYNPVQTTLSEMNSGIAVDLDKGDSIYYTFTVPETGVIQFRTSDAYSAEGKIRDSMPFQQQVIVNGDRISAFTSFMSKYKVVVKAGDTITFAVECPGYAVEGGYTLYAEYVPPFVLDQKTQGDVFSGMYMVEYTSNEDGEKYCMYAVRFNYGKKTVSVANVKDGIVLGTYNWTYNLETGALDIIGAPYGITVEEDPSQKYGCSLKLHYNGGYAMVIMEEIPEPSPTIAKVLTGKYEDIYKGKVYEVLSFDFAAGTVTIADDWNSKGTVYTMGEYNVFTGEIVLTPAKGEEIVIRVSGGQIYYYENPLTPVEAPHVHEYTSKFTAPTCTEGGYTTFTCECGDTYKGEEVAATGHKYEVLVTAPTCTEGGYTTNTCSVCGDVKVDNKTEAAGHKYEVLVTAPTCTEGGYTTHTCSVCGDVKVDSETVATGHHYSAWTDAGENHKQTCSGCGDVIVAEHAWDAGVVITDPTEETAGEKKLTCADCGAVKSQVIPALGHTHKYTSETTAPTCTAAGYTTFICTCGDSYKEAGAAALGHKYTSKVTAPTCTEGGYTTNTCSVCGDVKVDNKTSAAGHKYDAVVTAPTCTEGGYTTKTCSVCGDVKVDNKTSAAGHKYDAVVTAPTCTAGGYTTKTCSVCGDVKVENETAPGAHTYDGGVQSEGVITYTCTGCGHTYTEEIAVNELVVPGNMSDTINGTVQFSWIATETGHMVVDNVAAFSGAYISVTINGQDAYPTENGYEIAAGDAIVITVTTYSDVTFDIPVYIYENQQNNNEGGAMEFDVTFAGWNIYEQTWVAPFTGTATFIVSSSNVDASNLTFRVVDAAGNFYNQYEFGLDADGNQFVSVKVQEGDVLTIVAYEDSMKADGQLHITVMEGEPALHEHTYGEGVVVEATCTTAGSITYTCTVCGYSYSENTEKAAHEYVATVTAATCTEGGFITNVCNNCGDSYVEAGDKATGHNYGEWVTVKEATTTETGRKESTCVNCGDVKAEEIPVIEVTPTTTPATEPATEPTTAPTAEPTTVPATTGAGVAEPQGGIDTIVIIAIVAVVVIGGVVALIVIKKKK